jgi:hypothetical protein
MYPDPPADLSLASPHLAFTRKTTNLPLCGRTHRTPPLRTRGLCPQHAGFLPRPTSLHVRYPRVGCLAPAHGAPSGPFRSSPLVDYSALQQPPSRLADSQSHARTHARTHKTHARCCRVHGDYSQASHAVGLAPRVAGWPCSECLDSSTCLEMLLHSAISACMELLVLKVCGDILLLLRIFKRIVAHFASRLFVVEAHDDSS